MIVIACYSEGTPYEAEARLLRASLERVGMPHYLHGFRDRASWYANTAYKADFIRAQRSSRKGPLLYVDVDAFVHEDCAAYFDSLDADFGAHWFAGPKGGFNRKDVCRCVKGGPCNREHRLLSGTLYFGDTAGARLLLDGWVSYNRERRRAGYPDGGGQRNLWATWSMLREKITTERLPGRYCRVFDKPWAYPADEPLSIEHTIASRDNRPHEDGRLKVIRNAARAARKLELQRLVAA